jgi:hypothetical protein
MAKTHRGWNVNVTDKSRDAMPIQTTVFYWALKVQRRRPGLAAEGGAARSAVVVSYFQLLITMQPCASDSEHRNRFT